MRLKLVEVIQEPKFETLLHKTPLYIIYLFTCSPIHLLHGLHNSWIWVKQNWQFFIPVEEDASFSCSWPDWLTASPPSLFRSLSWLLCFLCLCFFFTGCWLMKRNCSGIWNMQNIYKLSLCMTSFETSMILSQSFWYKLHLQFFTSLFNQCNCDNTVPPQQY